MAVEDLILLVMLIGSAIAALAWYAVWRYGPETLARRVAQILSRRD